MTTTPEHEAQARQLLEEIAQTQPWARIQCSSSGATVLPGGWTAYHEATEIMPWGEEIRCILCAGKGWISLFDLEVAAWRAWVHISEHRGIWQLVKVNDMWEVWFHSVEGGCCIASHREPKCAVFEAVLNLKGQANA